MFNKRPINPVRNHELAIQLHAGYDAVHRALAAGQEAEAAVGGRLLAAVDGTHGVDFARIRLEWERRCAEAGWQLLVIGTERFLRSGAEIREAFRANITDNRAFGYVTDAGIDSYFRADALEQCRQLLAEAHGLGAREPAALPDESPAAGHAVLLLGTGAHWLSQGLADVSLFCDLPREHQQVLHKRGLGNFALDDNEDALEKYKIAFFVEWPILEGYRKQQLSAFDWYVDMADPEQPVGVTVEELTLLVQDIARHPFRVKPFFAPGIWGGQYLKALAGLPEDMDNCAWSFEPIAPENSILIEAGGTVIELPFLVVMAEAHLAIMGERAVGLFGDYFPIRFDYLDTIGGSNLSCQVHPKQAYLREHFNGVLEQQESYYIMEQEGDAKVYLGLTEECEEEAFIGAVEAAQATGEPIEFTRYVQEWDSRKGDLFLIPTGTVHCSGAGNLVLEISATTWWFTFKIYDYVRQDRDGKPRAINIDHAKPNIDYYKRPGWVQEQLIQQPRLVERQAGAEEYVLGQRDDLLFYVNRIELAARYEGDTDGEFVMLNLVEGERVRIESLDSPDMAVELGYAESYVLPAAFGRYALLNLGGSPCRLVKAGVSPAWDVSIIHE